MTAIVRALDPDLGSLVGICGRYHHFESIASTEAQRERALRPLLQPEGPGAIFLSRVDGVVTGYLAVCFGYSIELGGRDAFIDEFFVDEEYRGRGLGSDLLNAALDFLRGERVVALHMEVSRDNEAAVAFYSERGFGRRDRYFLMTRGLGE